MSSRYRRLDDPESLRRLVEGLKEGIYIATQSDEILDGNAALREILGVSSIEELRKGRVTDFLVDPAERERELGILGRDGAIADFELKIRRRDGQVRTVRDTCSAVVDPDTHEILHHGIFADITDRKGLEEQLLAQSLRDPLTGCYNRRYLAIFAAQHEGGTQPWGCIVADLDRFKEYNDQFGNDAGDALLNKMARFLMRQTRAEEVVVRTGADEFLLLIAGADEKAIITTADRLKFVAEKELFVDFSMGWAAREGTETLEETIQEADKHLNSQRSMERTGPISKLER